VQNKIVLTVVLMVWTVKAVEEHYNQNYQLTS